MAGKTEKFLSWKDREDAIFDLLEFGKRMTTVEQRLESFKNTNWAYSDDSPCNINALAYAGWFYYPKSQCPTKAYCFMTLRCVDWKEQEDPWKEQKKNICSSGSDHPLGVLRSYVP